LIFVAQAPNPHFSRFARRTEEHFEKFHSSKKCRFELALERRHLCVSALTHKGSGNGQPQTATENRKNRLSAGEPLLSIGRSVLRPASPRCESSGEDLRLTGAGVRDL